MKSKIVAALVSVGAFLAFAPSAFAHNVQSVQGTVDCAGHYTITGSADWYGGHWLKVSLGGNVVLLNQDNSENSSSKPFSVSGKGGTKGESITTETLNPNQSHESTGPSAVLTRVGGPCSPPPPKVVYAPQARFNGPCGDPMYRAVFDNRKSSREATFVFRYVSFATGRVVTVTRYVAAHTRVRSSYVHVLGRTVMYVREHNGKHTALLAKQRSAPPGNYRACA